MSKRVVAALLTGALTLSACAKGAEQVTSNHVPSQMYSSESCTSLRQKQAEIVYDVNTLTGKQNSKARTDAIAVGVGVVLFWPALFLLAKDAGNTQALADAKGRYETIDRVGKSKGCWS